MCLSVFPVYLPASSVRDCNSAPVSLLIWYPEDERDHEDTWRAPHGRLRKRSARNCRQFVWRRHRLGKGRPVCSICILLSSHYFIVSLAAVIGSPRLQWRLMSWLTNLTPSTHTWLCDAKTRRYCFDFSCQNSWLIRDKGKHDCGLDTQSSKQPYDVSSHCRLKDCSSE